MPKRRLSERQIQRIQSIQERRRRRLEERAEAVLSQSDEPEPQPGRIVVRHGANLAVEDSCGQVHHCLTRRNIGHPVCGDEVVWQPTTVGEGVVTAILERKTLLSRPGYGGRDKPLAANISALLVLLAPRPEPSGYLLDQYLVAAARIGVQPIICCNKMDLLDEGEREQFLSRFEHYQRIGYPLVPLSVTGQGDLTPLTRHLDGQLSILVGQSGVGKSSLVKALLPDQDIQIGMLSKATGLGRHTTSAATCYRIGQGGYLIDSPGVRSFRLGELTRADLERGFPELEPHLGHCRFADCRHNQEPDCAIRRAADQGAIDPRRLASFLHMLDDAVDE